MEDLNLYFMKKFLFFIFIFLIVLTSLAYFIFYRQIFSPIEPLDSEEKIFIIERGEGSKEIALSLEEENLIKWAPLFRFYVLIKGIAGNLKAGEYVLSPSMNIPEITDIMVKGETIKINIVIPEGFTKRQIEERLGFELPGEDLEGFLFPDTYQFSLNMTGVEAVKRMRETFEKKLTADLREEIERQGKSIFEIVTMASMIEKEVRTKDDKKLVSGILWKRLEVNMPLQVDATIAYILERDGWSFNEMRREIGLNRNIDSPYNTYKYSGLPLGPISNPGLDSIIAAIYPEKSNFWYYLSTPEGETIFSRTLQEHNIARAKYF